MAIGRPPIRGGQGHSGEQGLNGKNVFLPAPWPSGKRHYVKPHNETELTIFLIRGDIFQPILTNDVTRFCRTVRSKRLLT